MKRSAFWDRGSGNSQRNFAPALLSLGKGRAVINRGMHSIQAIDSLANRANHGIL